jgi:pimeloyl-ACP methyl ester carboxylesterase
LRKEKAVESMSDALEAPRKLRVLREASLGLIELPRLLLRFPQLALQPRGKGQPVLILPGYGAGDGSTAILKAYLRLLGYNARGWGLGRNTGATATILPRVLHRLASLSRHSNQSVQLIGWSFGGYLAREIARERPELVHQVITLGTPVIGGPKYTVFAEVYRKRGIDVDAIVAEVEHRNRISLRTPVVAIYSRIDGFVAWRACIDRDTPTVEHVEVRTTHLGLGFSPDVYNIIAQRLIRDERAIDRRTRAERPMRAAKMSRPAHEP